MRELKHCLLDIKYIFMAFQFMELSVGVQNILLKIMSEGKLLKESYPIRLNKIFTLDSRT